MAEKKDEGILETASASGGEHESANSSAEAGDSDSAASSKSEKENSDESIHDPCAADETELGDSSNVAASSNGNSLTKGGGSATPEKANSNGEEIDAKKGDAEVQNGDDEGKEDDKTSDAMSEPINADGKENVEGAAASDTTHEGKEEAKTAAEHGGTASDTAKAAEDSTNNKQKGSGSTSSSSGDAKAGKSSSNRDIPSKDKDKDNDKNPNAAPPKRLSPEEESYQKMKKTLKDLIAKKNKVDRELEGLEERIFVEEGAYLQDASAGNVAKGFEHYTKGSQNRRKSILGDQERVFSQSSTSFDAEE